jgi:hypothetical protein
LFAVDFGHAGPANEGHVVLAQQNDFAILEEEQRKDVGKDVTQAAAGA